jgi:hypothetical protein
VKRRLETCVSQIEETPTLLTVAVNSSFFPSRSPTVSDTKKIRIESMSQRPSSGPEGKKGAASSGPEPTRKLRKRVFVAGGLLFWLVAQSIASEGIGGLFTAVLGATVVIALWMGVWHLFLKHIPTARSFVTILLSPYTAEEAPMQRRRKVVLDYGDGEIRSSVATPTTLGGAPQAK